MKPNEHEPQAKVLVALDGSSAAATALPLARRVATRLGARLEILHVVPDGAPDPAVWDRLHRDLAEHESVVIRSQAGEPAAAILEAAAEPGVTVLVLATHGREVEPPSRLGRVGEALVSRTIRPILLVRPEAAAGRDVEPLRRVLLPLDGTPTTAFLLPPAIELARRLGFGIDLLHVAPLDSGPPDEPGSLGAPRYVDQAHHEWPGWAREIVDRLRACLPEPPPGVPIRAFLARGDIGEEIVRFAVEHGEHAIVLVRRSGLEPGRARVLRAVLERMPCPALLVGGLPAPLPPMIGRPGARESEQLLPPIYPGQRPL
jgi:nucleotide-binding universal stress UspA family protein